MSVCLLSTEEVGRLRNYDIKPTCHRFHRHISLTAAIKGVSEGLLELIADGDQQYVVKNPLHKLAVVGVNIQRIRGIPAKYIQPAECLELPSWEKERILK